MSPTPRIARSRRQACSWRPLSRRSTRPRATSRATRTIVTAREGDRPQASSWAGASPATVAASGTSWRPACSRPWRNTIRRWIADAREPSISCSVTAQASASQGSGRRRGRSQGLRRSTGPSRSWRQKRRWKADRSWSTPIAKRIRRTPSAAASSDAPSACRRTAPPATQARTTTGSPATCSRRVSTPPELRSAPSRPPPGNRYGPAGTTSCRTAAVSASAGGRRPGTSARRRCPRPAPWPACARGAGPARGRSPGGAAPGSA